MSRKTAVSELASLLQAPYRPLELGAFNDHAASVLKFEGDFGMHNHAEDEFYFVLDGEITVHFKNAPDETLKTGEALSVPAYVTHSPESKNGALVMVVKRKGTFYRPLDVE